MINRITRIFTEALGWTHGVEFLCVAFQNRVAYAMGGTTLHSGGDMGVGGEYKSLSHTDVDVLFTRNQCLRWLLIDDRRLRICTAAARSVISGQGVSIASSTQAQSTSGLQHLMV